MNIKTGKGLMPLISLIAILSVSLLVNLPGLAISPVLANLDKIFPGTSQLSIQMLTILPNLFIIPFVLLSGQIASSSSKSVILLWGLGFYLASGIMYLFTTAMWQLIAVSCLLGVGCGLLIPLAASLITDNFDGKARMQMLGIKSGVANLALIMATLIVGWLGNGNWHLPFVVYLLPIIPLALFGYIRSYANLPVPVTKQTESGKGFIIPRMVSIIFLYFGITFFVVALSYYLPFLLAKHGIDASKVGTITAIFFFAVFLPGFILPLIVKVCRHYTVFLAMLSIAVGLGLLCVGYTMPLLCIGAFLMGWGYGIIQPTIYDKATRAVNTPAKNTMALAIILATNYVAITIAPFIIDSIRDIIGSKSDLFPFQLNVVLAVVYCIFILIRRKSFAFDTNQDYLK
ncbi:MFS transporter [Bacteroides sp.]|uniref:MFS transporter n=1 Tax=Bacteroides sp. TaxID=29523 RepID=UPI002624D479|nr:MFS transporter [Bacteroides sp.]